MPDPHPAAIRAPLRIHLLPHVMRSFAASFALAASLLAAPAGLAQTADSTAVPEPAPVVAPAPTQSLAEVVQADTALALFAEGLTKANLMAPLADTSKVFTVLAVSNDVLRGQAGYVEMLAANNALGLFNLLMQHLVPGSYLGAQLPMVPSVKNWTGNDLLTVAEPLSVGGLNVVEADRAALNGYVHRVDGLFPVPTAGTH